jgi:TetR/AcrR family transcriptional regulator, transcriptional repressor for nem operon
MTDTRTSLLDAAEKAVRERGYDAFSYADLAETVGIRKASIHYHFPTKADLASATMLRYAERHFERLAEVAAGSATAAQALDSFVSAYRNALGAGNMICLCVAYCHSRGSLADVVQKEVESFQRLSLDWLEQRFGEAICDDSISAVRDPAAEAAACLAMVQGAQIIARAFADPTYFDISVTAFKGRLAKD